MRRGLNFMRALGRELLHCRQSGCSRGRVQAPTATGSFSTFLYLHGFCQRHLGKLDAAKDYLNLGLEA